MPSVTPRAAGVNLSVDVADDLGYVGNVPLPANPTGPDRVDLFVISDHAFEVVVRAGASTIEGGDIFQVSRQLAATRLLGGQAGREDAQTGETSSVADLRDALLEQIAAAAGAVDVNSPTSRSIESAAIAQLSAAAQALDTIAARAEPPAPLEAPVINVERLAADVWNACQEADVVAAGFPHGTPAGSTQIADVAVAAIRKVLD